LYFLRGEKHSLFYDMYYQNRYIRQAERTSRSDILINSLIGYRQFTNVFSGNAKVMREKDSNANDTTSRFVTYEGSLLATGKTLPKLHHNAVTTVKKEEIDDSGSEAEKNTVSFYITNDAEIYPGINALVTGGRSVVSTTTTTTDTAVTRSDNKMLGVGTNIVPHRSLLISLSHNVTEVEQDGPTAGSGSQGITDVTSRTTAMNASFSPITTLYIYGSITKYAQTGQPHRTSRAVSGSWTFQQTSGALELRFIYSEDIQADTATRNRIVGPYARWRMNPRMFLDASYVLATTDSPSGKNESKSFNTSFKLQF
jgi:hypothetical protein